jgi:hypothetical protein
METAMADAILYPSGEDRVCAAVALGWQCGNVHDRDVNAARNIAALGHREALNASGDGVRPPLTVAAVSETGTLRGAA